MTQNRLHFTNELRELHSRVVAMGSETLESFKRLIIACEDRDEELAKHIVEHDKVINGLEESINVDGYLLIAKQCPVASDLRQIISALKISNELERIADYSSNVAKYLVAVKGDYSEFIQRVVDLCKLFIPMLIQVMNAYQDKDVDAALQLPILDEELDELYKSYLQEFIKLAQDRTDIQIEVALRVILILKQIERAGDHAVNMAEQVVYMVNGKMIEL